MEKGFIFNHNLCVNCSACRAACILENGWTIQPRTIYTYNSEAFGSLPLINLSLACNHCEIAVCMDGCPSASISREPVTGAIVVDERKCIGCKYCQWNCPYDAPKFDPGKKVIGKCNLCYSLLTAGGLPACANACPTGALKFGWINYPAMGDSLPWLPDKDLNPKINLTATFDDGPLKVIPDNIFGSETQYPVEKEGGIRVEWTLFAFSFLATISVATIISSLINGIFPDEILFLSITILAGLISVFHPGRGLKAWRAVTNILTSPLSREIVIFIIYALFSSFSVIFLLPGLLIASSVTGLILLIAIDSVYRFSDNRKIMTFHSGQTFLSGLLIASFFTGFILPFVFIAGIKLISSSYRLYINKSDGMQFGVRFIRIALLIVSGVSMASEISYSGVVISSIFLIGEFLDRIIFYSDFLPVNINSEIIKQINIEGNEKKRD
jgi:Fe-S-cluster-containing dehydrogenase component/DMSO reductase anchor subunit